MPWFSVKLMQNLYWFHMFFALVYYIFALVNRSDSWSYYARSISYSYWFEMYQAGTKFIDFVAYPFTNYLFFTYEMTMVLFAWFGYWGFVYFYCFFKENINFKHKLFGFDIITIFIFLPNMHYWTSSLGKGSIIFWGIGMAMYGLSRLNKRKLLLILGLVIVYHIRPHVFLFMAVAIIAGLFTGRQKVPAYQKFLVIAGSTGALILMYDQIIAFAGLDSENLVESFDQFSSHRSHELSKSAGSGMDISSYPLILKLFTFWFRPLFVDSPNPIGFIVSCENLLYLFLAGKLFQKGAMKFLFKGPALVKTSAIIFLATTFALSGTLSNLGLIIRQKSMIMYFFLFVILAFLDYNKGVLINKRMLALERKKADEVEVATN